MGGPDKIWVAIGLGAIVLPAMAYGHWLHHAVFRDWFGGSDIADPGEAGNAVAPQPSSSAKSSAGEP